MSKKVVRGGSVRFLMIIVVAALVMPGCQSKAGTGALVGGGVGAGIGGAIGGWKGAAIGGAIGIGAGYIIGNEADKKQAKSYTTGTVTTIPANELRPFAGTRWELVSVTSDEPQAFKSLSANFMSNGIVVTTKTDADGLTTVAHERYRVVGSVLIVNRTGYVLNFTWTMDGNRLFVSDMNRNRKATLRRVS